MWNSDEIGGLSPSTWIVVGEGYSREDVKDRLFSRGRAFTSAAVTNPGDLASRLGGIARDRVIAPETRQEALRALIALPRISRRLPELARAKRSRGFLRKLDRALMAGRGAWAHEAERDAQFGRLRERLGGNPLREELSALASAYEDYLGALELHDSVTAMRAACERLEAGWPIDAGAAPRRIHWLSTAEPEGLEAHFLSLLGRVVEVLGAREEEPASGPGEWAWERWHTLDDGADALARRIAGSRGTRPSGGSAGHAILIPDLPEVRRSLTRALARAGVPLADPRDPTRLRSEEAVKRALLPLEAVASDFERRAVVAWLQAFEADPSRIGALVDEIHSRGIRRGLRGYSGGRLTGVHERLRALQASFGGRMTLVELGSAHGGWLAERFAGPDAWVAEFFAGAWEALASDLARLEIPERRAPLLFWLERLRSRLELAKPPNEKFRPASGVALYRLGQAPVEAPGERLGSLWLFGVPPQWLDEDGTGDYWYSERDREILGAEFAVRCGPKARAERKRALGRWLAISDRATVVDAEYDPDGRERETLLPLLRSLPGFAMEEPESRGAEPARLPSWGALRAVPPQEVLLSPRAAGEAIKATELDLYSACPFRALADRRWKLRDLREPEADLWPDVRGSILHKAAELLISSGSLTGAPAGRARAAVEEAWRLVRPRGLLSGARVEEYAKARLARLLVTFLEREDEYRARSGARPFKLEEEKALSLEFGGFSVVGRPDRIDETEGGIFVIDYKTTSTVPKGSEILESGYRLQLPFYALAAAAEYNRPAVGAQFVQFDRKGTRNSGILLKSTNGGGPGKLTQVRGNSKSLFDGPAEPLWTRARAQIETHVGALASGRFPAAPKAGERDCRPCMYGDLCGRNRLSGAEREADA